jgi:GH15 family glucan-1,4-alpha-glucosidase
MPLRSYALLGDMRGAALVSSDGEIDWLAVPSINTPPVCAAMLDPESGGSIQLAPTVPFEVSRRYLDTTLILETTFTTENGTVRVTDALNRGVMGELPWSELARRIDVDHGEIPMHWSVRPGHGLQHHNPWSRIEGGVARVLVGDCHLAVITGGLGQAAVDSQGVTGRFVARGDVPLLLAVTCSEGEPLYVPEVEEIMSRVDSTAQTWRNWAGRIRYGGPWGDLVVRSALTLKGLTVAPNDSIAGAATTSLPEKIGGERNFDYRYAWIRDSSFVIDAMARLGLSEEVHASLAWLLRSVAPHAPDLRAFYNLDGEMASAAMRSADVPGYEGSTPVHVGNAAADQTQLGCFGDLLDAIWRHVENGGRLDPPTGNLIGELADRTCELWHLPDAGLWELGEYKPYTISKMACWVALDRALRLADAGQLTNVHEERWRAERATIRSWIDINCWSANKSSYTFYAGTEELDAAVLLAARTGYCSGDDPRLHSTIDAVAAELGAPGPEGRAQSPLLYRYSGQEGKEGTFIACSCWMVEALIHAGRVDEAARRFEGLVDQANDVGLYAEEMDPTTGEMLGNMPQALSHLAIIGAALSLAKAGARQSSLDHHSSDF